MTAVDKVKKWRAFQCLGMSIWFFAILTARAATYPCELHSGLGTDGCLLTGLLAAYGGAYLMGYSHKAQVALKEQQ